MEITYSNVSLNASKGQSYESDVVMAKNDILGGLKSFALWHYLAVNEVRRRYRRTIIGPFWTTLSVAIFISIMGFMLSLMWKTDVKSFLPYFCTGYITWTMLSTVLVEGCSTFISSAGFLRQLSIPYCIYACLVPWRNFLVLGHHLVTVLLVLVYCRVGINANVLFIIPGLCIIFVASVALSIMLGMICARFRDVKQLIESALPLVMFVTPIMWKPDQLGRKGIIFTQFNPVYHYVSLIRQPLLGEIPSLNTWIFSIFCTAVLLLAAFVLFSKKYRNIIFWL